MTLDEVKKTLAKVGYEVEEERPLKHGVQLRLTSPQIVNVFTTGKVQVQGKAPRDLRELFKEDA